MAGERVIVSWNVTNWITVVLMVVVAFLIFGALAGVWHKWRGSSGDAAS
jgi:hypothetical protein